jgi:hypothetical protein
VKFCSVVYLFRKYLVLTGTNTGLKRLGSLAVDHQLGLDWGLYRELARHPMAVGERSNSPLSIRGA